MHADMSARPPEPAAIEADATRTSAAEHWFGRARLIVAAGLSWLALEFIVGSLFPGLDRPATLGAASHPLLAGIALAGIVLASALFGQFLVGRRLPCAGLFVAGIALSLWPIGGGVMDDWLMLRTSAGLVAPPEGSAYVPLIFEYLLLLVVLLAAAALSAPASRKSGVAGSQEQLGRAEPGVRARLRAALGLGTSAAEIRRGLLALAVTTVITGTATALLTGPAVAHTLRGQVYFAVAVAVALGVYIAGRLVETRRPLFYWPAPLLAGLVGVGLAAARPALGLPPAYNHLNFLPAWGLARALPVEMAGVGVVVALWLLRAGAAASGESAGSR